MIHRKEKRPAGSQEYLELEHLESNGLRERIISQNKGVMFPKETPTRCWAGKRRIKNKNT